MVERRRGGSDAVGGFDGGFTEEEALLPSSSMFCFCSQTFILREKDKKKVLLGIGGGHYAPRHMDVVLGMEFDFIHGLRKEDMNWDLKQLVGSGGMLSSHSADVANLATAIGFKEGFGGPLFATTSVLACIL